MASRTSPTDDVGNIVKISTESADLLAATHDASHTLSDAADGTVAEKEAGFLQSLKTYRKAVGWSVLLSVAIIMEGFDLVLVNSFFALPAYKEKFGEQLPDGSHELSAAWQSGLSNGTLVGQITGILLNGYIADKFGYKKTMIGALCLVTVFIFVPFFSPNIHVLLLGQILLGIPFGIFQTLTCTYASEVCPTQLRAYMTTWVNLSWIIGQILASGVLRGTVAIEGQWSYRIPMALQWVWPIPLIIGISFAPESPWYLVRKGRIDQARHSILRLTSKPVQSPPNSISATNESSSHSLDIEKTLALMIYTNNLEIAASAGTSYLSCFRRTDLRRTELTCFVWAIQVLCGSTLMSYSTYFYLQAGLDVRNAFTFTLGQYCLGFIGTLLSWGLMGRLGRRTLYLSGQITMVCLLLIIGFTSFAETGDSKYAASWAIGSMLLVFTFVYDCTVGPVCYSLVTELPSTRLKTKTVVLARTLYNISGIVVNITSPLMLNPTAWHWGAKSGFFWAGIATLCVFWTFFRLPEPKGRTYAELDVLFEAGVKARKFKGAVVEGFAGRVEGKANNGEGVIDGNEGAGRDEKRS